MDRSLMLFILAGVAAIYFITNFVSDIQSEDESFRNSTYNEKNKFNKYRREDSIGREILDVTGEPEAVQIGAWNASPLKKEFLEIFPDFSGMQMFIEERLRGKALKSQLKNTLDDVEGAYFSGTLDAEDAKRKLGSL
jgi:hypothetical protein